MADDALKSRTEKMLAEARSQLDPSNMAWLGEIDALIELKIIEEEEKNG